MPTSILYLNDLNVNNVAKTYAKVIKNLQQGDFKSADVRKMPNTGYYRARLDIRDRLLFTVASYEGQRYILILEVIKNHDYAKSRFLRGASFPDESQFLPIESAETMDSDSKELVYLNKNSNHIHLLNKFISFDKIQNEIYSVYPPLIIVGSAGSGKTALVLEKLKELPGEIAYISLSKYLVENASQVYYSNNYGNDKQEVEFLSLHQYLSSWETPQGTEVSFRQFEPWFLRYAQAVKLNEPYRIFEEFKGVITGSPIHTNYLSKKEYLELGVKQSIFSLTERERLYPLFLEYVEWLKKSNLYDSNILCHDYLEKVSPRYDYVVVDEVQDITNIQLKCILQSLKHKSNFILTGDSNQIVHPNFFSWSKLKSYFYTSGDVDSQIKILQTNYRNSLEVVEFGNKLLKIKNARFGSIDKESNYLIETVSTLKGEMLLYSDDDKKKKELNRRTQDSTHYAVIVPSNEHKAVARQYFKTPLIFSIQEAKGLEYDNVILMNFVSNHEAEFREIIRGVTPADLLKEELSYNRAGDKHDKDAEVYKFYINALYVAVTRAVKNIFIFEKQSNHPALQLLQMIESKEELKVAETKSTTAEWLAEAERLEAQGKIEQAEQIRAKHLGYEYLTQEQLEEIKLKALDETKSEKDVKKERKQLFTYAVAHKNYEWVDQLAKLQFQRAVLLMKEVRQDQKEYAKNIRLDRLAESEQYIKKYGVDFVLNEEGANGLMIALQHGQKRFIDRYMQLNASLACIDKQGRSAAVYLLMGYFQTVAMNKQQTATAEHLSQLWHLVHPHSVWYSTTNRKMQLNPRSMVYFLLLVMRAIHSLGYHPRKASFKFNALPEPLQFACFSMPEMEAILSAFPEEVLPAYRKKRPYINSVLAGHELNKDGYPISKKVFARVEKGIYTLFPFAAFTKD